MEKLDKFKYFLLTEKGQRESTNRTSIKIMRKMLLECLPFNKITFEKFIFSLLERKAAVSYIKQHIGLARQWGECFDVQELKDFPYPKIKYNRPFLKATFSDDEIQAFLSLPNPFTITQKRKGTFRKRYDMWILFYTIQAYTGMRTIEISGLKIDDVDFGRNVFILEVTKTGVPRLVPIPSIVKDKLKDYIVALEQEYLFPPFHSSSKDKGVLHVGQSDWNGFFKKQIKRLGIKRKNLTPYSFRHTYGTRMAEEDVNIFKIKELMGHSRIETTQKYIHIGLKSLQKIQENDRLLEMSKNGKEMLRDIQQKQRELEEKYKKSIYAIIEMSENGRELNVLFKVR